MGGASVQSTAGTAEVCAISGSNAGYTMFRGSVKWYWLPTAFTSFPFNFPSRALPCDVIFQQDCNTKYGRLRLKCDGTRAETRFRLSAKRIRPFKSGGGRQFSRLLAAEVCAISGSNA